MKDLAVHARQLLRDLGPTRQAARQIARMMLHLLRGATRPGLSVEGIRRLPHVDYSLAVPFERGTSDTNAADTAVAAVCHIYHLHLVSELRAALANIPGGLDIFVSTDTEAKRAEIYQAFSGWTAGDVQVRLVVNRGRDIAPKLTAFNDVYERYKIVLFLHTKSNSNVISGTEWRQYLLHNLLGSPEIAVSVLDIFRKHPEIGIVAAQHWEPVRPWLDWSRDFATACNLARRMGIILTPAHVLDFPSGSMFWARTAALRPLLELGLSVEDFPTEGGQLDGTIAHAVERLFFFSCERAGFDWIKVCDPKLAARSDTVVQIKTPSDVGSYKRRHGFRLTAQN